MAAGRGRVMGGGRAPSPTFAPRRLDASARRIAASRARWVLWPTLAVLALYALIYGVFAEQLIAYPYELDQGEGYDVWSAWLLRQGQLPYSDNEVFPYFSSNYPPVWSMLAAAVTTVTGPTLAAGRVVSAVAGLACALVVGVAAARRAARVPPPPSRGRVGEEALPPPERGRVEEAALPPPERGRVGEGALAGALAAGLFLASPYVFHTTPLARVNSLALLFALIALLLAEVPTMGRMGLCVLALLASLFTKPTAIDAAAACVLFAIALRPWRGIGALALLLLLGGGILAALNGATSGAFWLNGVEGNINAFELGELGKYALNFAAIHAPLLVLAGSEAYAGLRRRAWSPWVIAFPLAALVGLGVGKWGAGESYLLGLIAVSSVLAGARIARALRPATSDGGAWATGEADRSASALSTGGRPPAVPPARRAPAGGLCALGAGLLLQMLLFAHGPLTHVVAPLRDLGRQADFLGRIPSQEERAALVGIAELMRRSDGPVLSEAPSLALAAGKPIVGNATHLRNLYASGLWDPAALVGDVRAHRFAVIVLNAQLYPAPVLEAIGHSYYQADVVQVGASTYQVFLPGGA